MTDQKFEAQLRPQTLEDFSGQEQAKKILQISLTAAQMRGTALDHVLVAGPSGLGKTTLAGIIANEMGGNLRVLAAPNIKNPTEMAMALEGIEENDIVFIDEIHRLNMKTEELLYFAMEDFKLVQTIDGEQTSTDLPRFTLIGATTLAGNLSAPLRNRFGIALELRPYNAEDMADMAIKSAKRLGVTICQESAEMVASRARGVPRVANGFLRRICDVALVTNDNDIDVCVVDETFDILGIDEYGLTRNDRNLLRTILNQFGVMIPAGLASIAAVVAEDARTLEEVVEPYLIQNGFLMRTARGRVATEKATYVLEIDD